MRFPPAIAGLVACLIGGAGQAQAPMSFSLDAVMIARIDTDEDDLEPLAKGLHAALERELSTRYFVVPFAGVPGYEDYDARTYLSSCPSGQYVGCVYVIGSRAKANWAVAGEMALDVDSAEVTTTFTVIDVKESQMVVSYKAKITPDNHKAVADGLGLVLDSVLSGVQLTSDVRGDIVDPRAAWEKDREARREVARDLVKADSEMGDLEALALTPSARPKMSMDEVRRWDSRDDDPPWQRLGMRPAEYVHYNNSGHTLSKWRRLTKGRFKRIMLSVGAMAGGGPYRHTYDGRWVVVVRDEQFQIGESDAHQLLLGGPSQSFHADVGFGVHPWIDVGAGIAARSFRYEYYYWREVDGDPGQQIAKSETYRTTFEYRAHATFAPMPTWFVRPTGTAMVTFWKGTSVDRVVTVESPLPVFPAPAYVTFHLAPGAEVQLSDNLTLFARLDVSMLLSGRRQEAEHVGETLLQDRYEPPGLGSPLGFSGWFGVTVRLPPIGGYPDTRTIHGG